MIPVNARLEPKVVSVMLKGDLGENPRVPFGGEGLAEREPPCASKAPISCNYAETEQISDFSVGKGGPEVFEGAESGREIAFLQTGP